MGRAKPIETPSNHDRFSVDTSNLKGCIPDLREFKNNFEKAYQKYNCSCFFSGDKLGKDLDSDNNLASKFKSIEGYCESAIENMSKYISDVESLDADSYNGDDATVKAIQEQLRYMIENDTNPSDIVIDPKTGVVNVEETEKNKSRRIEKQDNVIKEQRNSDSVSNTAVNLYENHPLLMGVLDGINPLPVSTTGVLHFFGVIDDDSYEQIEKAKQSKAYKIGVGIGVTASLVVGAGIAATAVKGVKAASAATKTQKLAKNIMQTKKITANIKKYSSLKGVTSSLGSKTVDKFVKKYADDGAKLITKKGLKTKAATYIKTGREEESKLTQKLAKRMEKVVKDEELADQLSKVAAKQIKGKTKGYIRGGAEDKILESDSNDHYRDFSSTIDSASIKAEDVGGVVDSIYTEYS